MKPRLDFTNCLPIMIVMGVASGRFSILDPRMVTGAAAATSGRLAWGFVLHFYVFGSGPGWVERGRPGFSVLHLRRLESGPCDCRWACQDSGFGSASMAATAVLTPGGADV